MENFGGYYLFQLVFEFGFEFANISTLKKSMVNQFFVITDKKKVTY